MASYIWVFYFFQGEDGEDRSHPNAFKLNLPESMPLNNLNFQHVTQALPAAFQNFKHYHFRCRYDYPKKGTFYWMDIIRPDQRLPLIQGRLMLKILKLNRPVRRGIFLRRKPLASAPAVPVPVAGSTPAEDEPPSSSAGRYVAPEMPPSKSVDRRASSSGQSRSVYSDHPPGPRRSSSSSPRRVPKKKSPAVVKQRESSKQPPLEAQESFEDFLSGTSAKKSPKHKIDEPDLMGHQEQKWDTQQQMMADMDPLASPRGAQGQKSTPKERRPRPQPIGSQTTPKNPSNSFQENGQTVGPVTIAEMARVGQNSADGSQVYNADHVDKSTKTLEVRQAMIGRERSLERKMARAKESLKARDEQSRKVEQRKADAELTLGPKLKLWAEDNGRKKNIRTLLSTMHTVMWPESRWNQCGMAKLLTPVDVKKGHRRAMLVVHPDKNSGRTPEQMFVAERVFDALNGAWDEFALREMTS